MIEEIENDIICETQGEPETTKCVWELEETKIFLKICLDINMMSLMDKKNN